MAREMKDSGKSWIGTIPSHWELMRIKNVVKQSKDGIKIGPFGSALTNKTIGKGEFNVYSQANLIASDFLSTKNTVDSNTFEELKNYEVFPGDICLSMMGTIGKCKKVPLGIKRGIMDSHLIKIRLSGFVDSRYFEYVYDKDYSGICFAQMQYDKKGFIMDGLNTAVVKNLFIPMPPLLEQSHISDYLDSVCSRIDSVIEQTRASIEEYKKLKQAVITQAVTKGIRPNREMKDSGIEWIGEINRNYSVIKIKFFISAYKAGPFGSALITGKLLESGNILVYTPEHIAKQSDNIQNDLFLPEERREEMQQFFVEPGFIIFPIVGSLGRAMLITSEMRAGIINQRLAKFKINEEIVDKDFFMYVFARSDFYKQYLNVNSRGAIIVNLTKEIVYNMPFPLPPIDEQKEIVDYLEQKCSEIDKIIAHKELLLTELESYKKSLIFEYVTGKKEVPA